VLRRKSLGGTPVSPVHTRNPYVSSCFQRAGAGGPTRSSRGPLGPFWGPRAPFGASVKSQPQRKTPDSFLPGVLLDRISLRETGSEVALNADVQEDRALVLELVHS